MLRHAALRCRRLLTTLRRKGRGLATSRLNLQQAVRATPPTIMPFSRNASDETGKALSSPRPPNVQIGRLFLTSCNAPDIHRHTPNRSLARFFFLLAGLYVNANKQDSVVVSVLGRPYSRNLLA